RVTPALQIRFRKASAILEVIIALAFRNLIWSAGVTLLLRDPYASIIPERLGHQRQLGLKIAAQRDTRRMDLRKTRVPKEGATAMGTPYRRAIRSLGVRREIEDVGISSGCQHNHVGRVAIQLARH